MQLIAVDIGNSSSKIAVTIGHDQDTPEPRWLDRQVFWHRGSFEPHLPEAPCLWIVSSVNQVAGDILARWVAQHRPTDRFRLLNHDDIPLPSNVSLRTQIGCDRLVAAFAAWQLNDELGPLVVIDAGTAVTIDLVDEQGVFQGGVIYPGASTILENLSAATEALPDLSHHTHDETPGDLETEFVGKSTEEAILLGVFQMQVAAINRIVIGHQTAHEDLMVYVTGGGIDILMPNLAFEMACVSDLVLQGCLSIGENIMADLDRE